MMKRGYTMAIAFLLGAGVFAQAPDLEKMDVVLKSLPDGPVAKVQGRNIEKQKFIHLYQAELDRVIREYGTVQVPMEVRAQVAMAVVQTLVERALLYREALGRELTVPEESVLKAWEAQFMELQQALSQKEGREFTEEEVLARLGYSERSQVLSEVERALITQKMRARIIRESEVSIPQETVEEIFNAQTKRFSRPSLLHLKQIYFDPENDTADGGTARERAEDALSRLFAGQSFEAVAKSFSEMPDSKRGGDMGVQPVDRLRPFIVEAAMKMKPDDISDIIESKFGFHIIMLVEKQEASQISLADAEPAIRRGLLAQEGGRVVREHCDALIGNGAEVKVFLELDKNMALLSGRIPKGSE